MPFPPASRQLLRFRSSLFSLVQNPNLGIEVGSPSAVGLFAPCSASFDGVPSFHRSKCWNQGGRAAYSSLPVKFWENQLYLRSSSPKSSPGQSFAAPSFVNSSQVRHVADDAVRHEYQKCWSCEQGPLTVSGLFCSSCNSIQPLNPSVDFFQIFSIDQSFNVDLKKLEQSYKNLQKRLHPDLAGSKSEREQGYSADQSAHVIQAYYILLRPLPRARYLLELHGTKVDEEGTIDDPELLMEIMEVRESLEETSDFKELKQAQAENDKRIEDCQKALEGAFTNEDLAKAVLIVTRLAYYIKVSEEILRKL